MMHMDCMIWSFVHLTNILYVYMLRQTTVQQFNWQVTLYFPSSASHCSRFNLFNSKCQQQGHPSEDGICVS